MSLDRQFEAPALLVQQQHHRTFATNGAGYRQGGRVAAYRADSWHSWLCASKR